MPAEVESAGSYSESSNTPGGFVAIYYAIAQNRSVASCTQRPRGRRITNNTQRELWAMSAGFCQKPECNREVVVEVMEGRYATLGEMAHIIAASTGGPRADVSASDADLVRVDNLILLCPTCHTLIDRYPEYFRAEDLMGWKSRHQARRRLLFGVVVASSRSELRDNLKKYLLHNSVIHATYGPESEAAQDPMSDAHETWLKEAVRSIVPNNRKMIELLEANQPLLTAEEKVTLAKLRVHADAFEARHVFGEVTASAPRFPDELNDLAKDG